MNNKSKSHTTIKHTREFCKLKVQPVCYNLCRGLYGIHMALISILKSTQSLLEVKFKNKDTKIAPGKAGMFTS